MTLVRQKLSPLSQAVVKADLLEGVKSDEFEDKADERLVAAGRRMSVTHQNAEECKMLPGAASRPGFASKPEMMTSASPVIHRRKSAGEVDDAHERAAHAMAWDVQSQAMMADLALESHHTGVVPGERGLVVDAVNARDDYLAGTKRRVSLHVRKASTMHSKHHIGDIFTRTHDHHASVHGGGDLLQMLAAYHRDEPGAAEALESHSGFYSDQALLQRESLRFEPEIRALLEKIWCATGIPDGGYCSRKQYGELHESLYRMMQGDAAMEDVERWEMQAFATLKLRDDEASRKAAYLAHLADQEFKGDAGESGRIDKAAFQQSWFQVCDLWAAEITCNAYVKILREMVTAATEVLDEKLVLVKPPSRVQQLELFKAARPAKAYHAARLAKKKKSRRRRISMSRRTSLSGHEAGRLGDTVVCTGESKHSGDTGRIIESVGDTFVVERDDGSRITIARDNIAVINSKVRKTPGSTTGLYRNLGPESRKTIGSSRKTSNSTERRPSTLINGKLRPHAATLSHLQAAAHKGLRQAKLNKGEEMNINTYALAMAEARARAAADGLESAPQESPERTRGAVDQALYEQRAQLLKDRRISATGALEVAKNLQDKRAIANRESGKDGHKALRVGDRVEKVRGNGHGKQGIVMQVVCRAGRSTEAVLVRRADGSVFMLQSAINFKKVPCGDHSGACARQPSQQQLQRRHYREGHGRKDKKGIRRRCLPKNGKAQKPSALGSLFPKISTSVTTTSTSQAVPLRIDTSFLPTLDSVPLPYKTA